MIRVVSAALLAGAVLVGANGTPSFAQSPADAVKERIEIMKTLWPSHYRDLAQMARGENVNLAVVPAKATAAADTMKKFGSLFPAGSGRDAVPDTRSKPEVWSQKAEFDAAVNALVTETNALGEAAKSGNLDAFKAQYQKVSQACGGCHGGPRNSGGKFRFEAQ